MLRPITLNIRDKWKLLKYTVCQISMLENKITKNRGEKDLNIKVISLINPL